MMAAARAEVMKLLSDLVGRELRTVSGRKNVILRLEADDVVVATSRSPNGKLVPIQSVADAVERLRRDGEIEISPSSVGYRSAFIGAVLRQVPGAALVSSSPPRIRLT